MVIAVTIMFVKYYTSGIMYISTKSFYRNALL